MEVLFFRDRWRGLFLSVKINLTDFFEECSSFVTLLCSHQQVAEMTFKFQFCLLGLLFLAIALVQSQDTEAMFEAMDTDKNHDLTFKEMYGTTCPQFEEFFKMDENKDYAITLKEFTKAWNA